MSLESRSGRRTQDGPTGQTTLVRRQQPVSTDLRTLSTVTDPDYLDAFTMASGLENRSPEQWARVMFEVVGGRGAQVVWRGLLGMRLHAGPGRIAGWAVGERGKEWIRLEAGSRFMTGQLVVRATEDQVSFATFIRYDRWWAGCIWRPLSAAHRRLSPGLLTDAYRLLQASD